MESRNPGVVLSCPNIRSYQTSWQVAGNSCKVLCWVTMWRCLENEFEPNENSRSSIVAIR